MDNSELLDFLKEEVRELEDELNSKDGLTREDIRKECADIANFAMMIADMAGNKYGK